MDHKKLQKEFFSRLGTFNRIDQLLDRATGVYFFIKDRKGKIIAANQLTIERCGCKHEAELIGKTDYDLFSYDLADKYVKDDRRVMETGIAIENMAELAPNDEGVLDCYITNKIPLYDSKKNIIGIAGATISYDLSLNYLQSYSELAEAIQYIMKNYSGKINIPNLAKRSGFPNRKFSEQFKKVMKYTPQTFIVLVRIHYASLDLINTELSIAAIANKVGFYDHSMFTRHFRKHMGMLPLEYRRHYS